MTEVTDQNKNEILQLLNKASSELRRRFDQASLEHNRYKKLADVARDEMLRLDGASVEVEKLKKDLQNENKRSD